MQNSTSFQVYNASAGSGKTFTLVKEYLKILLTSRNAYKFQQILAVTFTNKAAGEMKDRVIENLHTFSNNEKNHMLSLLCNETELPIEIVFKRSQVILNAILQNYSAFCITTIDSFTHKLIRTFAYDLNLPVNFDVEMDAESLLNEAVDVVISKIGDHKDLTELLVSYSLQKLDDDKAWDISQELKSFAKIILNENHATHLKSLEKVSIEEFKNLKEELQKEAKSIEEKFESIGLEALKTIKESGVEINDFSYSGELQKHFIKLKNLKRLKPGDLKFEGRLNTTLEENKNLFSGKCTSASKQIIESIAPRLKKLYNESKIVYREDYSHFILNNLIVESLIPLAVLNYINVALKEIKDDNNILLIAEFNQLISDTIKNEPAPFIYERIGEKFRYYFIDEMQDTSVLQWQNLIPLIDSAISSQNEEGEQGKLLLVGDAKQSIYRWRGGKSEQFIELSSNEKTKRSNPFYIEKSRHDLDTNYRSSTEIVSFNNDFFKHISQFLTNNDYKKLFFEGSIQKCNSNKRGFVQLSFVEKPENDEEKELRFPKKVVEIIENLDSSFHKNEVCVLVRTKKQGIAVANYLSENNIEIISSETLLLRNSEKIGFIIDLLYAFQYPLNKEYKIKLLFFIYKHLKLKQPKHSFYDYFIRLDASSFYEELKKHQIYFNYQEYAQCPFYESFEYIIRSFKLASQSDSNIQFFLDVVFEFIQKKQATISEFLEYWELKKDTLSIVAPEAKNAIRIMTIHKAKGLEFPVVIFPYDLDIYRQINPKVWYKKTNNSPINSMLINYSSKLNYVGKQGIELYEQRREELELDNYNLLYVTLTRAEEQLYVISEKKISPKNEENLKFSSGLFIHYLKSLNVWNPDQNEYSFGVSTRDNIENKWENKTLSQTNFISNSWKNHNISIVANSSLLWGSDKGKAIIYGNLIHEILSKIKTKNDILDITNLYVYKGLISLKEQKRINTILNQIIHHKKLSKYFDQNNTVYNEQEIITADKKIVIPDRLIFNNNKVTIIDYKTGKPNKKYHQQLANYAKVLENLGYSIDKKILVYINKEIIVEEV